MAKCLLVIEVTMHLWHDILFQLTARQTSFEIPSNQEIFEIKNLNAHSLYSDRPSSKIRSRNLCIPAFRENWISRKFPAIRQY